MVNRPKVKISKLCTLIVDCVNKTAPSVENETPFRMIRTPNIKKGRINLDGCRYVEKETFKKWTRRAYVEKGDVLLTREAPMGEVGMVNYDDSNTFLGQRIMQYRADSKLLDPHFLLYSFLSPDLQYQFGRHGNTGSIVSHIKVPDCFNFELSLPPIRDQKRIAKVLSDLDTKIELNNKINAELEAMAKLIYDYWFVQFDFPIDEATAEKIGNPSLEGKPYKTSGGKMVYNKELKREIPEGWENGFLSDLMQLKRGVTYNKDDIKSYSDKGVTPVLRATNISLNKIDLDNMVYVPDELVNEEQILKPMDILITMSSGSKAHIGKNGFYYFDEKVAFGAFCARIVPNTGFQAYVYSYMQSDFVSVTIQNECLGTNINNLNGSLVKQFRVVVPQKEILQNFNTIVDSSFKRIGLNMKENQKLSELRDWLLPMLMNGQVRVGEDAKEYKLKDETLSMAAEAEGGYGE